MSEPLTFPFALPNTVGNHRLSRLSISKNTASCSSTNFSSFATSDLHCATDWAVGGMGCPGMGMERVWPVAFCRSHARYGIDNTCEKGRRPMKNPPKKSRWPVSKQDKVLQKRMKGTHHPRKDPPQPLRRTLRLGLAPIHTIFEFEQRLTDRVGKGDAAGVDEGYVADAPALKGGMKRWWEVERRGDGVDEGEGW